MRLRGTGGFIREGKKNGGGNPARWNVDDIERKVDDARKEEHQVSPNVTSMKNRKRKKASPDGKRVRGNFKRGGSRKKGFEADGKKPQRLPILTKNRSLREKRNPAGKARPNTNHESANWSDQKTQCLKPGEKGTKMEKGGAAGEKTWQKQREQSKERKKRETG